jgi:hypothetical protein
MSKKNKKNDAVVAINVNKTNTLNTKEGEKMNQAAEETKIEAAGAVNTDTTETKTDETQAGAEKANDDASKTKPVIEGKCEICYRPKATANQCRHNIIKVNGAWYDRVGVASKSGARCDSCGIVWNKGNIHHYGCAHELCPVCGLPIQTCECTKQVVALSVLFRKVSNEFTYVMVPNRVASQEIEDFLIGLGLEAHQGADEVGSYYRGTNKVKEVTKKLKKEFGKLAEKIDVYIS